MGSWDKINGYIRANPTNFISDPNNTSNTYGTNLEPGGRAKAPATATAKAKVRARWEVI